MTLPKVARILCLLYVSHLFFGISSFALDSLDCKLTWTSTQSKQSPGGLLIPAIKTFSDCFNSCIETTECAGVDIDTSSADQTKCYYHFSHSDFDTSFTASSTTQFHMKRCPEEGMYLCEPFYQQSQAGQFSAGGKVTPQAQTLDQCRYACQDAAPSCVGFDYSDDNTCYLHSDDTFGKNLNPGSGTNEYQLIESCETVCNPKWVTYENIGGVGALPAPVTNSGKNVSVCLEFCLRSRDCAGVEFTPGDVTPCVYYKTGQEQGMKQYQVKVSTTQYQLNDSCFSHCTTGYNIADGVRFHILKPRDVVASNAEECKAQCSMDAMCAAFEYTTSGPFLCTLGWSRIAFSSTPDASYASGQFVTPVCTED